MCEGGIPEDTIGPGSEGWGGGAGSGKNSVGYLIWGSSNNDSSGEGGDPSSSPLTVAPRASLVVGKPKAR